ncbi:MAG: DNA-binding protein [Candidatus Acidiferrales bacterium]
MTPRIANRTVQWISVAIAARILAKSARTVERYIEAGLLRARRTGPRGWQEVMRQDVEKLAGPRAA